jgi:RND family efflux transporter MFP subunit
MFKDKKLFVVMRVVVSVLVLGAGVGVFFGSGLFKPQPRQRDVSETVRNLIGVPVELGKVKLSISGFGKVQAVQTIALSSEVKGRIIEKRPMLKPGALLNKGEVLLRIDKSDYEAQLIQTEADIKQLTKEKAIIERFIVDTEEQLKLILRIKALHTDNYDRIKGLYEKQASYRTALEQAEITMHTQAEKAVNTNASLEKARLQLDTVEAQIKRAVAEKDLAANNINRCVISCPVKGRLKASFVEEGEYVNVGQKLFDIADDSSLEIPVSLDAGEAAKVLPLQQIASNTYANWFSAANGIPVIIEWLEAPERSRWHGKVLRLEEFDSNSGTFKFVVSPISSAVNGDVNVLPLVEGMFCKVKFQGGELANAMLVPWIALQVDGKVFVVNRDGVLEGRRVKVYSSNKDALVVTSGLEQGEYIVTQKLPRGIVNGMKINVAAPADDRYNFKDVEFITPVQTVQDKSTIPAPVVKPDNS